MRKIVIGSRSSELAITQANWVIKELRRMGVENEIKIKEISTKGDRNQKTPLSKVGGKGIFTSDIQMALQDNEIDFAVHSLKDLPLTKDDQFLLASFPKREDYRDAYIGKSAMALRDLPDGSVIGTSSPRRASFIHAFYPNLKTASIRGSVNKRLEQLEAGKYDGIVLAVAGLNRLNLSEVITEYLQADSFIPAVGQGALAIECRTEDEEIIQILKQINDKNTEKAVLAEREFARILDRDDEAPIGAYAEVSSEKIILFGSISSLDGQEIITVQASGSDPRTVAQDAANQAKKLNAGKMIEMAKEAIALS